MRKLTIVLAAVALALVATGCNKLRSRSQVNEGVQAFKGAQYPQAVEHFKNAVDLDPTFLSAREYLAVAYYQQYIPGAVSPENTQMADAAYDQFQKVLQQDPKNQLAIMSIASLFLNQQKWDDAKQWFEKAVAVAPNNADAYYSLGFIAWSRWFPEFGKALATLGMRQEDPGPIKDKKVREALKEKWEPVIDDGLKDLDKALDINPEYDDAMSYENLLIRERAYVADSKEEYEQQIKIADAWLDKAMATKKSKEEKKAKQSSGGIVNDSGK
ncbi:MAG: tetratricopeptide repeat protein [Bryobacteraceae bacterium]